MAMNVEEGISTLSHSGDSRTPRALSPSVVQQQQDMVNLLSGLNMRKLTSGSSSGSSEVTPLLNGSHEGPCYAYSSRNRDDEGELVNSLSTVQSNDDAIKEKSRFLGILKHVKLVLLSAVMLFCVVSLTLIKVHDDNWNSIAVTRGKPVYINVTADMEYKKEILHLRTKGPYLPGEYYGISRNLVTFRVTRISKNGTYEDVSSEWQLLLAPETRDFEVDTKILEHDFILKPEEMSDSNTYQLTVTTNKRRDYVSMFIDVSVRPELAVGQIIMAICVLIGLYILIIFEVVHRTLAAMIGATVAISCLALVGVRPSLMEVMSWMDVETLSLLFGMMVLVSILCETGFFDYVAVLTYKLAKGQVWALITGLCLVTAVLSAFLDNVTTILLMSAVAIRLCEAMNIDPKHMLIAMVIFSNLGGAMTPIGDPPNVIIISNKRIKKAGIGFGDFTLHMLPVVVLSVAATYVLLRFMYKDVSHLRFADPPEVVELKHEIEVWRKAFNSLSGYSRDEDTVRAILHRKITVLETLLRKKLYDAKISEDDYRASLKELTNSFKLKNTSLLLKSGIIISIVIIFFFLESIPDLNLSIGWIAILGAIFLLVLGDFDELESVLSRVEWSTLLFFGALFVVMEALSRLNLVWYIVNLTQDAINSVDESHRLLVAIVLVLWISAFSSSIIDNIPFTTVMWSIKRVLRISTFSSSTSVNTSFTVVMVQVVADLADNEEMKLPIKPLVFALALGACFGGNGTLIGASANVVTAGLSEQHGYRFSFYDFFRVGFPVMILTTAVSTAYLLLCHVWLGWND